MANNYDVNNWYWFVGGDKTQVFSSASKAMVPVSNSAYQTWANNGNKPTNIDTLQNLYDVVNAPIEAQIMVLETKQHRNTREYDIAVHDSNSANAEMVMNLLKSKDTAIAALRGQLLKV